MPFTSLLDEIGARDAIPDDFEDEADEAAEEDVGTEPPAPPADPAESELSDLDIAGQGAEATIDEGEDADIGIEVENVGGQTGSFDVNLEINGESSSDETDELGPGESESVTFEGVTSELEPAEYNVTVSTDDDEVTGELSVEDVLDEAAADPANSDIDVVDLETDEFLGNINGSGELEVSYQLDEDGESAPDIESVVLEIEDQGAGELEFNTDSGPQKNFESFEIAGGSLDDAGGFNPLIDNVTDVDGGTGPIVIDINQDFDEFGGDLELEPGDTVEFKTAEEFVESGPDNDGEGEADISIHLRQETGGESVFEDTKYLESV